MFLCHPLGTIPFASVDGGLCPACPCCRGRGIIRSCYSVRDTSASWSHRAWLVSCVCKAGEGPSWVPRWQDTAPAALSAGCGASNVIAVLAFVPAAAVIVLASVVVPCGEGGVAVLLDAPAWLGVGNVTVVRAVVRVVVGPLVLFAVTAVNWSTLLLCTRPRTRNIHSVFVANVTRTAAF